MSDRFIHPRLQLTPAMGLHFRRSSLPARTLALYTINNAWRLIHGWLYKNQIYWRLGNPVAGIYCRIVCGLVQSGETAAAARTDGAREHSEYTDCLRGAPTVFAGGGGGWPWGYIKFMFDFKNYVIQIML
jgi:hypothetical protein